MADVIYKIRVNRPCRLFIDDEEMMILDENKLAKITLPEGECCDNLTSITIPSSYITIGVGAFPKHTQIIRK